MTLEELKARAETHAERLAAALGYVANNPSLVPRAIVEIAASLPGGVSQVVARERMNVCATCEYWQKVGDSLHRCAACGCLEGKLLLVNSVCPTGRW